MATGINEDLDGHLYGSCWVTAWTADWAPGERTRSALRAQVKAVLLCNQKGWSLAAPLLGHLRADCHCGRISSWRSLLCEALPCEPRIFWYGWAIFFPSFIAPFYHASPSIVTPLLYAFPIALICPIATVLKNLFPQGNQTNVLFKLPFWVQYNPF